LTLDFTSDHTGTLTWPGGSVPIQRFDIVPGGSSARQRAGNPQSGWWWNPAEGGRGYAIESQNDNLYFAAYMYDSSGNPVWYLASGALTSTTVFQGTWMQFANGETLTGTYQAPTVLNSNVGSATLNFTSANSALLTLPDGRQIPLVRFLFGNP